MTGVTQHARNLRDRVRRLPRDAVALLVRDLRWLPAVEFTLNCCSAPINESTAASTGPPATTAPESDRGSPESPLIPACQRSSSNVGSVITRQQCHVCSRLE